MVKHKDKKGYLILKYNAVKNREMPQISSITVETDNLEKAVNDFVDKNTYDVTIKVTKRYTDEYQEDQSEE